MFLIFKVEKTNILIFIFRDSDYIHILDSNIQVYSEFIIIQVYYKINK